MLKAGIASSLVGDGVVVSGGWAGVVNTVGGGLKALVDVMLKLEVYRLGHMSGGSLDSWHRRRASRLPRALVRLPRENRRPLSPVCVSIYECRFCLLRPLIGW